MRLTAEQRKALALTDRGRHTLIVKRDEMSLQPLDLQMTVSCLPSLVDLGLMTREDIEPFGRIVKYSLTKSGLDELRRKG